VCQNILKCYNISNYTKITILNLPGVIILCEPSSAKQFFKELKIKTKTLQIVSGGGFSGSCNSPFHHHGFEDIEDEVVEKLVFWINSL
tara:strand:- start:384 stop:647 length:264 start_codon:yes stop_codon:yes gene_type:complete